MGLAALGAAVSTAAAAQDLTAITSQQASSPETAWSVNIAAPAMRGEIARNLSALSVAEPPHCPPGQAPEAKPLPAVGEALPATLAPFTCVVLPVNAEADLSPTQGQTSKTGSALTDGTATRTGASLAAVSRPGTSLGDEAASRAGTALTSSPQAGAVTKSN
jgi:hypothetical protein